MIGIKYIDRINVGTKVLVDSRLEMFNVFNHSYFCVCVKVRKPDESSV